MLTGIEFANAESRSEDMVAEIEKSLKIFRENNFKELADVFVEHADTLERIQRVLTNAEELFRNDLAKAEGMQKPKVREFYKAVKDCSLDARIKMTKEAVAKAKAIAAPVIASPAK